MKAHYVHRGASNEYPQHTSGASDEYPQHMFSWRNKKNKIPEYSVEKKTKKKKTKKNTPYLSLCTYSDSFRDVIIFLNIPLSTVSYLVMYLKTYAK